LKTLLEPDDENIKKRESMCLTGQLLCGECKTYLSDKLVEFLSAHQQRRIEAKKLLDSFKYTGALARELWSKKW
jgi:tryptophanyl-tRNA synthetase